jgi:hypothetical protein
MHLCLFFFFSCRKEQLTPFPINRLTITFYFQTAKNSLFLKTARCWLCHQLIIHLRVGILLFLIKILVVIKIYSNLLVNKSFNQITDCPSASKVLNVRNQRLVILLKNSVRPMQFFMNFTCVIDLFSCIHSNQSILLNIRLDLNQLPTSQLSSSRILRFK